MAAENAFSAIDSPMKTEAVVMGAMSSPARPARLDDATKASTTTAPTLMPISAAACLLAATARTALPTRVRRSAWSSPSITAEVTASTRTSCGRMPAPPRRMTPSPSGEGIAIEPGPQTASAVFCTMMPKPIVLITQAIPEAPKKGRTAVKYSSAPNPPSTATVATSASAYRGSVTSTAASTPPWPLPAIRSSAATATKDPATRNSPWPKFSVFVVVWVMLKPSATRA